MSIYIPVGEEISPAWLNAVLRQSGHLSEGDVVSVAQEATGDSINSRACRLRVRYTDEAPATALRDLLLKRNHESDWGREAGADEGTFYALLATLPDHPAVTVPCYAAAYDEASGASYLLLRDLTETHTQARTRDQILGGVDAVPSCATLRGVVQALAQLHAYWWEHPLLATTTVEVGYWYRNAEHFERYLRRRTAAWQDLIAAESSWFPADLRELYERVLEGLPRYWENHLRERYRTRSTMTLIHGDTYFNNFLCPRDTTLSEPTYLIDWQSPECEIVGFDLANLLATFWTPKQRHDEEREVQALRTYHAALQAGGVASYTWDELVTDYQHGLIYWLLVPLQDRHDGSSRGYWWPKMQCLAAAFDEWRCMDLLALDGT